MKKETVCIQIGTAANHVGAHFWNLHDEYLSIPPPDRQLSPATFLREEPPGTRAAKSGLRYSPRVQIIDATSAFGALSTQAGAVLGEHDAKLARQTSVQGNVRRYVRQRVQPSRYVKGLLAEEEGKEGGYDGGLEEGVRFWSDYLKMRLHPRSCFALPGVHYDVTGMEVFEKGVEVARGLLDEVYDELRGFVEECDAFGGVCMSVNADDAYGGFAERYLTQLNDELGSSSPVFVFGVHDLRREYETVVWRGARSSGVKKSAVRYARNEAMLVSKCLDLSAQYIPLSSLATYDVPLLHVKKEDLFQTSAVLGLSSYVALAPLQQRLSLANLTSLLRPTPFACFGSLTCNFPSAKSRFEYGKSLLSTKGSTSLSNVWMQYGITTDARKALRIESRNSYCPEVVSCRGLRASVPVVSDIAYPVTVPIPFPAIFDASLERNQFNIPTPSASSANEASPVEQIAVLAGLTTEAVGGHVALKALGEATKPAVVRRARLSVDMEEADLREVADKLISRSDDYLTL